MIHERLDCYDPMYYRRKGFESKDVPAFLEVHGNPLLSLIWMCLEVILKVNLHLTGMCFGEQSGALVCVCENDL